jgi:hypothetical protein
MFRSPPYDNNPHNPDLFSNFNPFKPGTRTFVILVTIFALSWAILLVSVASALCRTYNGWSNGAVGATDRTLNSARSLMMAVVECGVAQLQSNMSYTARTRAGPHKDPQEDYYGTMSDVAPFSILLGFMKCSNNPLDN